ncbi:DNA repair protein REV1 [Fusarium austroafricanum]|uniref:DNA repair protein REV1 n=1 Tax=Fusarium austroafricanum TaxID=2364996 RepID=A0A8H4JYC3_9HYPO|nr:DNA repair protein REV1 [Fusarium austroafricanum]
MSHHLRKAAEPQHAASFDPWNSTSTGHQRPESHPGTGWRESRNRKLNSQFRGGSAGGERLSDTWGAGSDDYDEKCKMLVPKAVKERAQRSVKDMLAQPGKMRESLGVKDKAQVKGEQALMEARRQEDEAREAEASSRGIFDGTIIHVNGSTFPLISDLKLKQLVTEHGGQMSLHLGRRRLTHVILGRPAGGYSGAGGLAGGKLEREIRRTAGCGVKILESLKAGKRLPEARFSDIKVAPKAQSSVYNLFSKQSSD